MCTGRAGAFSLRTNSAHAMRCAAPKCRGQRAHASTHLSVFSGRPSVVKIKKKMIMPTLKVKWQLIFQMKKLQGCDQLKLMELREEYALEKARYILL